MYPRGYGGNWGVKNGNKKVLFITIFPVCNSIGGNVKAEEDNLCLTLSESCNAGAFNVKVKILSYPDIRVSTLLI